MTDKVLLKEKVLTLLDENKFMTLATALHDKPWAVTVTYAFDEECNLFFTLLRRQNIVRTYQRILMSLLRYTLVH